MELQYIFVKMRYEGRIYKSQSFGIQRENKENNDNSNFLQLNTKRENLNASKIQKKISNTTSSLVHHLSKPEDIKSVYSRLVSVDYSKDIFNHLFSLKQDYSGFLNRHSLTSNLRSKMVDWMIEVLSSYKMTQQTFFRSVSLMDLYIKESEIKQELKDLHLIGLASMFMAAKYQQIYPFKLTVIYDKIARKKFTKDEIIMKQNDIISALNFQLERVTLYDYVRNCINQINFSLDISLERYFKQVALYLAKMSLYDQELVEQSHIQLAGGVIFISLKTLQQSDKNVEPEKFLSQISEFFKIQQSKLIETSRKVLNLAKNFSKIYPNLSNLKKFNKFQYTSQ